MSLKFQRNIPLVLLFTAVTAGLVFGIGERRIIAYTVPGVIEAPDEALIDISNTTAVFDESQVHKIEISMDAEDYETMLLVYRQTGEKQYFHASVTIDGVTVNNVGIRLKGNASLRQALGGGRGPAGRPGQVFEPNPGSGNEEMGNLAGGNPQTQTPLLIKFDEFVSGQAYQGYDRLAIRSAGTRYNAAMLQEPLTNHVFRLMGLPATKTAYAGVSLNGGEEYLYTLSEVIEEKYLEEHFENGSGILYKAEVHADMRYQGEDPSRYTDSFEQQTRKNDGDMSPLIDFIKFVTESDDETFENELPGRLDTDAFATYLAINSLLVNNDSMAGMGNNYYLYFDDQNSKFTVLMWDANESLGTMGGLMGAPGGGMTAPGSAGQMPGAGLPQRPGGGIPAGPRAGGQPPVEGPFQGGRGFFGRPGMAAGADGARDAASADIYPTMKNQGGGNRREGGTNLLLSRFMSATSFKALYEEKVVAVYETAFESGAMAAQIDEITAVVQAANTERNFVDANAYEQAAEQVVDFVKRRGDYIGGTDLVKGGT